MLRAMPQRAAHEMSNPSPRAVRPPRASVRDDYLHAWNLHSFVERHGARLHDPETAFYVSQALEDCAAARDVSRETGFSAEEQRAAAALAAQCSGFAEGAIEPRAIVELVGYAARWGEPHAAARMLLFRDIAEPKDDVLPLIPWMLASREPSIVRDVGAFLSRGEAEWRYGHEDVPTAIAALAWDLAACDLDRACHPWSRFGLSQCVFLGRCSAGRYEDALASLEPPELMAQARALRTGILRALRDHDWEWLGLK